MGDISFGVTKLMVHGDRSSPDVLATAAVVVPTGEASIANSLSTPGSSLGDGFWAFTVGLTFICTYDPVVVFYGAGFNHRLPATFEDNIEVTPGEQIFYRLGVGFAINPQTTFSAAFNGSYISQNEVNDITIEGSSQEPMSIRLAATILKDTCDPDCPSNRTVEPFAEFGITDEAIDANIGVSWTF
jgi:hypothetical protein